MRFAYRSIFINFSEPRFSRMLFYSLFFHLLILVIITGIPSTQRDIDFTPFYTVDLVNLPVATIPPLSSNIGTETTITKSLSSPRRESKKSPEVEKDLSKELDATIARIKEKVSKEKSSTGEEEIARTLSEIREKITIRGEGRSLNTKAGTPHNLLSSSIYTPASYQMNLYLTAIWEKIRNSWHFSESFSEGKRGLETIIAIKINRKGEIVDINFEKRSGNHYLDESAMRAIKKSNPFPPLPEWLRDEYLEIGIRFKPSDLV